MSDKISVIHEVGDLGINYGVTDLSKDEAKMVRQIYKDKEGEYNKNTSNDKKKKYKY